MKFNIETPLLMQYNSDILLGISGSHVCNILRVRCDLYIIVSGRVWADRPEFIKARAYPLK